jgi:dTDP-4-amino-4,6-dideoxygalactose transaminase
MTTGEGGIITTNDESHADELRLLRSHGSPARYEYTRLGYNYRMTEIQAAIGIEQLKKMPRLQAIRRGNATTLNAGLDGIPGIAPPTERTGYTHAWHQYTIRVANGRDELKAHLESRGVYPQVYYPTPLHKTELFRKLGYNNQEFPVAEKLSREVLSLPVHPGVTNKGLARIIDGVWEWANA